MATPRVTPCPFGCWSGSTSDFLTRGNVGPDGHCTSRTISQRHCVVSAMLITKDFRLRSSSEKRSAAWSPC